MCSAKRPSAKRAGSSVLDALGAIAFLSVALLGLSASSITLTRGTKTADAVSAAAALAQQKLEELRSMPLGASALASGQYYDAANPLKADGTSGGPFSRSWTVSPKDIPHYGLKTVTVTVAWTDTRAHQTPMAAYVRCSVIPCP